MNCDVRQNAINYALRQDLVDEDMKIISPSFGLENQEMSATARSKYGVTTDELAFNVETKTAKILYPTGNREDERTVASYAIPNEKFFAELQVAHDQYHYVLDEQTRGVNGVDAKGEFYQTEVLNTSIANKETIKKMEALGKQMGVSYQDLAQYKKDAGLKDASVIAVADTVRGVIAIATGREAEAITEETVHIARAIIEQTTPSLVTSMIAKIDRFKIYNEVLKEYSKKKAYQLANGKPDIRKIKQEAVDKLIAEVIINQNEGSTQFPELMQEENVSMIKKWWNAILDLIRGMYNKSNISVFEEVGQKIGEGEIGGTVRDIKAGDTFYQVKNPAVDNYYNQIKAEEDKIKKPLVSVDDTRHYTYDGQRVAESVTEKIKRLSKKKFDERKGKLKIEDDQKAEWGTQGHKFVEDVILNELVDKDGYAIPNPVKTKIDTNLNNTIQDGLREFATKLIASYPEGTRFLSEVMVINKKEKGLLASTVDFKAIIPDEKYGYKIDTLDWKFIGLNKDKSQGDIPFYKQDEFKKQMGEYTKIDYNYGAKRENIGKARMIPFIANYTYSIKDDTNSPLIMSSIEIGKVDSLQETNIYLLPIPTNAELTGNKAVDVLLDSFRSYYDKLYKSFVDKKLKYKKDLDLEQLSKAIRTLHVKLDFAPLTGVGKTFLNNASKDIKSFEGLDYSKMSGAEINKKLGDLMSYKTSAEKFINLDKIFVDVKGKEGMSDLDKETLTSLEQIGSSTERMLEQITKLQRKFAIEYALKEKLVTKANAESILAAETEIDAMSQTFLEGSKLSSKIANIVSNTMLNSSSLVDIKAAEMIDHFGNILIPLEKEASSKGKSAFDLIGTVKNNDLELIQKLNPELEDKVKEAATAKDKRFFLENIDVKKYNELAKAHIDQAIESINETVFSTNANDNANEKDFRIKKVRDMLDMSRDTFNGYDDYVFKNLFYEALDESKHLSNEYIQMSNSKNALDMWNFLTVLNERAIDAGYLSKRQGSSFFPLMEASMLQKLSQTSDIGKQLKDFFKDSYTVKINEHQAFSKLDPETNKVKLEKPKYFVKTDKNVEQLSKDLNKVGTLWIRTLLDYESKKNLEFTLLTLHQVDQSKGHIVKDGNNIVFEGGAPKIDYSSNKNADILQTIINDYIYNIGEDLNSLGNIAMGKIKLNDERQLVVRKGLQNINKYKQVLAVGLKPLVAIPNWCGYNFQAFINAGNFMKFSDFEAKNVRIHTGIGLTTIEKGLINKIVPLNEDVVAHKRREIAGKQGFIKWLGAWNSTDVLMSTNSFPERLLQMAHAAAFNENSMVLNGEIVNIRQHLREEDRKTKYAKDDNGKFIMNDVQRKALEKTFEQRVQDLKESSSLLKTSKIEGDDVVIPGVSDEALAKYRTKVIAHGRNISGQMSSVDKADYRRDSILKSFMMFKNWIPVQVRLRTLGIKENMELGEWEYGRTRLFVKTWAHLGLTGITKMASIIKGTEEGLNLMKEMLDEKRKDYYNKTGQELSISDEEFYDMVRKELTNQGKELGLLVGLMALVIASRMAKPTDDEDRLAQNRYKWWAKATNKISDELAFYYDPRSMESITKGSVVPALGVLVDVERFIKALYNDVSGNITGDTELVNKSHPLQAGLKMIPFAAQFDSEILPYVAPDISKEMGIRVSSQARQQ